MLHKEAVTEWAESEERVNVYSIYSVGYAASTHFFLFKK
jgi:hypothetical protein